MKEKMMEVFQHLLDLKGKKENRDTKFEIKKFYLSTRNQGDKILGYECDIESKSYFNGLELQEQFKEINSQLDFLELLFVKYYFDNQGKFKGDGTYQTLGFVGVIVTDILANNLDETKKINFLVSVEL
jgi:hypothetical protein